MTPEEKFNQDVLWVLQKIKEKYLATPEKQPAPSENLYRSHLVNIKPHGVEIWLNYGNEFSQRKNIIYKLQEWKAFKVLDETRGDFDYEGTRFILEILQPKFDELYKKYETANNLKGANEQWVDPFLRKIENGKIPYIKDGLFYSVWKYTNASRLTGKSLIAFTDLTPLKKKPRFAIFEFLHSLRGLKIELEDITFHEDFYKKYCKTEHDYITNYIAKNPKADFSRAIKKLFKNQATFDDIFKILGKFDGFIKMKLQLNGLLEFIEFNPSPSIKNIKPLKEHLETYIKCFIEDKLFSLELKNFYRFARQKEIFLYQIEREVKDYGQEFVFKQGEIISVSRELVVSINKDEAYLFIHTLATLETQGFFEIESISITDMDVPPEKQTDDYKIKILATEKLLGEYEPKVSHIPHEQIQKIQIVGGKMEVNAKLAPLEFKEPKEKQSFRKISLKSVQISYDDDEPAIKIGKQNVALPPYKNDHYFCRTIFEHTANEPVDWSVLYEKMTGYYKAYYGKPQQTRENWRLVYDAMRSVNTRVKELLKTEDNLFTWQEKTIKRNY